jgi:hypothetical protein
MQKFSFNRPAIYTSLLSEQARGIDGKHAVYSNTVLDEFTVRTPDALMNGTATQQLIQNCCPDITTPGALLSCDIQHLLASIKIATQGPDLEFNLKCTKCGANDPYEANLQLSVPYLSARKWFSPLKIDNITIYFEPLTYEQFSTYSISEFKLNKQLYTVSKLGAPEEYGNILTSLLDQKYKLQSHTYAACIKYLTINEKETVVKHKFIEEWFNQCDVTFQTKIINYISDANKEGMLPDLNIVCSECQNKMLVPLDLDVSTQFRQRLIPASESEILDIIKKMGDETKEITNDILKMIWYMRGAISYNEAFNLTSYERKCIAKIIEENMEITKKIGMPYI